MLIEVPFVLRVTILAILVIGAELEQHKKRLESVVNAEKKTDGE